MNVHESAHLMGILTARCSVTRRFFGQPGGNGEHFPEALFPDHQADGSPPVLGRPRLVDHLRVPHLGFRVSWRSVCGQPLPSRKRAGLESLSAFAAPHTRG